VKYTYEEAAQITYLADRAENLGSEIKQVESRLHWLKKEHEQVVKDAHAVREIISKGSVEEEQS